MDAVGGDDPTPAELLLYAESHLLDVRMFDVVGNVIDTNAEDCGSTAKGVFEVDNLASCRVGQKVATAVQRRTVKSRQRQEPAVQQGFQQRHFRHHAVVVDAVTAPNYGLPAFQGVPDKADAWSKLLEIPAGMPTEHVFYEVTGIVRNRERAAGVQVAGLPQNVIRLPAQAQVQRQIRARLPIILNVRAEIGIGVKGHDGWARRCRALECNRSRDISVVDNSIPIPILGREIFRRVNAPAPVEIEQGIGTQVLPFDAEAHCMVSCDPTQAVTDLVTIKLGALRNAEISAVLQAREADFVPRCQSRGIGYGIIRIERRNGVQEPVRMKAKGIHQAGRNHPRPVGQG